MHLLNLRKKAKMKSNRYIGYHIFYNIIKFAGNIWYGSKVIGKNNIPKNGSCILAGNHTSNFDPYLLFKGTNRPIHFIAKKELFKGSFGWFFKIMHLIPVDRDHKNPEAKNFTLNLLNNNKVIGIFPEGTFHDKGSKTKKELLLPFKPGAISFAEKSGAPIIPFAIIGKFKFRSKPTIVFGKPIYVDKINGDKVEYLENTIKEMIIKNKTL